MKKVHLISLGCARNRVDSEVMLGTLLRSGWQMTDAADDADAVVVNTCGFIQSAKEESIDTILSMAEHKKTRPDFKLVVAGCLAQRYKSQLARGLPEVDFFIGTDEFHRIDTLLNETQEKGAVFTKRTHYLYNEFLPRVNTLTKRSAYVKVAEGCQHNCAFCIIPAIRGKLRSRPISSVVREVMQLVDEGVLEFNLIAQDLAAYGRDLEASDLTELLKMLVKIDGVRWLRLLYVYPENISDALLEVLAREEKIVKYLDIPVQHASNNILKRMNRQVTREQISATVKRVRERIPEMAIRTTVMVGFPGETEEDFNQLLQFVEEQRFTHLGCFTYSQEEGTVAGRMPDQIDEKVKKQRQAKVMALQQKISREEMRKKLGGYFEVLVQGPAEESEFLFEGRLSTQAPEVDGKVLINDGAVVAGQIQRVLVTEAFDYDLIGRVES